MTEHIINWIVDTLARTDILDLDFIHTDLIDIPLSDEERSETAFYDAFASHAAAEDHNDRSIPIGKLVV